MLASLVSSQATIIGSVRNAALLERDAPNREETMNQARVHALSPPCVAEGAAAGRRAASSCMHSAAMQSQSQRPCKASRPLQAPPIARRVPPTNWVGHSAATPQNKAATSLINHQLPTCRCARTSTTGWRATAATPPSAAAPHTATRTAPSTRWPATSTPLAPPPPSPRSASSACSR